ncbi:MAG: hypothetical protein ACYDCO_11535 [Armatimonadota bacterium]
MGKQINFFVDQETEEAFLRFVFENDFLFVEYYFSPDDRPIVYNTIDEYRSAETTMCFFYRPEFGELVTVRSDYNGKLYVVQPVSPVIEFIRTNVDHSQRTIRRGRIWIATQWYDANDQPVYQYPELMKDYGRFAGWLKKHAPYRDTDRVTRKRSNGETYEYVYKEYITDTMLALYHEGYQLL